MLLLFNVEGGWVGGDVLGGMIGYMFVDSYDVNFWVLEYILYFFVKVYL